MSTKTNPKAVSPIPEIGLAVRYFLQKKNRNTRMAA